MADDDVSARPTSSKKRRLEPLPDFVTPTAVRVLTSAADFNKKRKFYERPKQLAQDRVS